MQQMHAVRIRLKQLLFALVKQLANTIRSSVLCHHEAAWMICTNHCTRMGVLSACPKSSFDQVQQHLLEHSVGCALTFWTLKGHFCHENGQDFHHLLSLAARLMAVQQAPSQQPGQCQRSQACMLTLTVPCMSMMVSLPRHAFLGVQLYVLSCEYMSAKPSLETDVATPQCRAISGYAAVYGQTNVSSIHP